MERRARLDPLEQVREDGFPLPDDAAVGARRGEDQSVKTDSILPFSVCALNGLTM